METQAVTDDAALEKREAARRQLLNQYRFDDGKFYFKGQPHRNQNDVAFSEKWGGSRLTTSSNDARIAKSIVLAAESKGWDSIKVSGNSAFKRAVWLEANLHGIAVKGFIPKEQDLHDLQTLQNKQNQKSARVSPEIKKDANDNIIAKLAEKALEKAHVPPSLQKTILEKIGKELDSLKAAGKTPSVSIYDKSAPRPESSREAARSSIERNAQRDKSR